MCSTLARLHIAPEGGIVLIMPLLATVIGVALATTAVAVQPPRATTVPSDYLYLWASSADSTGPDFLAVYDVRDTGKGDRYGALITTRAVPGRGHRTHHTDHALAADRQLFANDFGSGESYVFDLTQPTAPRVVRQFEDVGPLMHPHSFWRLPNGNVLATFQMQHDAEGMAPGGLVEMTPRGDVVRASSARQPGVDRRVRPYSAAILPEIDRVVVTTSDMDNRDTTRALQFWRLSDLSLQHTIELPPGPRGDEGYRSAEPRILSDGKTVLVSTFNCGLYLLDGIASDRPSARLVHAFPRKPGTSCAVPVVAGHYYLITVPAWSAVVSLDVSDPAHPREVSRVTLGPNDVPHWIGMEPNHQRVVITGYQAMKTRVIMANFDARTGRLSFDERFRAAAGGELGLRLEGTTWPHGGSGAAVPHGAVFSVPAGTAGTLSPAQAQVMAVVDSAMAAINAGDLVALSNVMTDSAQVYAARERDGAPAFVMRTAASQRAMGRRAPIIERGFDPEVRIAGTFASVWLPYDLWAEGKWSHCGVDQFTLVRVDTAWRIVNLTYSVEQPPVCRMHPDGPPPGYKPPVR
jgi:hypothetical protein